jgi:CheY-like chemotaxis protein
MTAKRILYVEDNPQNKRLVHKILTAKGFEVLEASDGIGGIETALREKPDLILMDINIPGIDGMEASGRLKKSEVAHIPIIALTANAMRGDRERILKAGCDEYLQKPVSNKVLVEMIERFIGPVSAAPKAVPAASTSASSAAPTMQKVEEKIAHEPTK